MDKKRVVVFDFDGVVADSLTTVLGINQTADPALTRAQYLKGFEGNIHDAPSKLSGEQFFAAYGPRVAQQKIVPGIDQAIRQIAAAYQLVIVSSTTTEPIRQFLQQNNLESCFGEILGADVHPSKIEKMKSVMTNHNVPNTHCIMITDTLGDIREAQKVKIATIAVTWGYHPPETLLLGQPHLLCDHPTKLLGYVNRLFKEVT